MTNLQWEQLVRNLPHGWWYSRAAVPATIIAMMLPLVSLFMVRSQARWWKRFSILLSAQVPLLLNLPAGLIAWRPATWLPQMGLAGGVLPDLQQVAASERLVLLALCGSAASLPIIGLWMLLNQRYRLTQTQPGMPDTFTTLATGLIGLAHTRGLTTAPAGTLTIQNGLRSGTIAAVRERAVIGKAGDIPVPDAAVASRHAQLYIEGSRATVADLGSPQGTYLYRGVTTTALSPTTRQPLTSGDRLILGNPARADSIVLLYQQEG